MPESSPDFDKDNAHLKNEPNKTGLRSRLKKAVSDSKNEKTELDRVRKQMQNRYGTPRPKKTRKAVVNREFTNDAVRAAILQRRSKKAIVYAVNQNLRSHITSLLLVILFAVTAVVFVFASLQQNLGKFTISLDREAMAKYGLALSPTSDLADKNTMLTAQPLENATNISGDTIPQDIIGLDGSNNGRNYIAYTFYIHNEGKDNVDYRWSVKIDKVSKNVDKAIRVAVYCNDSSKTVYAKLASNGKPEPDTVPFVSERLVQITDVKSFEVGASNRYTVVIWLEGNDPDCIDELLGGSIKMNMYFEAIS